MLCETPALTKARWITERPAASSLKGTVAPSLPISILWCFGHPRCGKGICPCVWRLERHGCRCVMCLLSRCALWWEMSSRALRAAQEHRGRCSDWVGRTPQPVGCGVHDVVIPKVLTVVLRFFSRPTQLLRPSHRCRLRTIVFTSDGPDGKKYRNGRSRIVLACASVQSNAASMFLHDAPADP